MKIPNTLQAIGVLLALWCITALTGCDLGVMPRDAQPAEAKAAVRVTVTADGGSVPQSAARPNSRTVVPANPGFAYTLTFSAEGKDSVIAALDGNTGEVQLDPGTWTLAVLGKKNGVTIAESDSVSVTAAEGMTAVTVTVHPTLNGAAGTFRYTVHAAAGLSGVSAALMPLNVGSAAKDEISLITGSEQTAILAPGYYRLTVKASKGTQPLIRREVVHIYSSTETCHAYDLTEADFASEVYLAGTLSGGIEGYSPVAVIAYEDAACGTPIDESEVSGGAWGMAVEATSATVYFKVKLEKGGFNDYYSKPVSVSGSFPVTGKTDIALAVAGYTVTFDAKGGEFEDGSNSMTMTAPENGTLTLPSAVWNDSDFVNWHSAGEPFTTETPVSGDTTVYAKWFSAGNIADYLNGQSGGADPGDPVLLAVNLDLAADWESLLSTIDSSGKYVSLDLSACAMDGTEFDPGTATGADKITALVLPGTAKSVQAGNYDDAAFKAFTGLASISGAGVEIVGNFAFRDCTSLTTVSLPVAQTIGYYAFFGCTDLTTVSLPVAQGIGNSAFDGCTGLTTVSLPVAQGIGDSAFDGCTGLTTVSLSVAQTIGFQAFYDCTDLTTVSLPAAQTIGDWAFRGCTSLTEVSLPMAQTIGDLAFYNCTDLTAVSLPAAQTIGDWAFILCPNLITITVDPANTAFTAHDGMLLNKAGTTLIAYPSAAGDITLPAITTIGNGAFYFCRSLTTVSLPAAQTIGDLAFEGCMDLTAVNLPAAQTIGDAAFSLCADLTTVSLPVAQTIGYDAFHGCTSLTEVSLPAAQTIGGNVFISTYDKALVITLPQTAPALSSSNSYTAPAYSKTVTVKTPAGKTGYDAAWEGLFKAAFGTDTTITLSFEDLE
jgi:hypothetical protein